MELNLLRNKPRLEYKGLTIVLSKRSRFDTTSLCSSTGGQLLNNYCLRPEYNTMQMDIRLADDPTPLLPNTKAILLLGEHATHTYCPETKGKSIGEIRGSPLYHKGIVCIPSFECQEAADIKDYEGEFNLNKDGVENATDIEVNGEDSTEKSRHGRTKRKNYAFWLKKDCEKIKYLLKNDGKVPPRELDCTYIVYPNSDVIINLLTKTKNEFLYFDIETDSNLNILCFAFSFSNSKEVYTVPLLNYDYTNSYSSIPFILRALVISIRDNILVAHNGAAFDFFVLAFKYRIAINKVYDTMLAFHRCFPDVEKSLGHVISLFTWEQFHKDEGSDGYSSKDAAMRMWQYCGKDVFTMKLIHNAIDKYSSRIVGLKASIQQANDSVKPYLIATLQGIRYDKEEVDATLKENDRLMTQYIRCINLLIGPTAVKQLKAVVKNGKSMAGSNVQCCEYFHNLLEYPVVKWSEKTRKPSLAKEAMFKLKLKNENPVIDFIIAYRELSKASGTLKFTPWKE